MVKEIIKSLFLKKKWKQQPLTATESEINGSVALTVPPNLETVEIDTVSFFGKETLSVAKETTENPDDPEQPSKPAVMLTVSPVMDSEQSEAVLTDVKIQKVLTVVQLAQISVNNVDISSAAINYEISNTQGPNKPVFTGNLEDPPLNISLNSLSPVPPDEDSRYVLIDGTFEENKCREWAYSINFGNSCYKYYLCEDSQPNGQSKGSTLERKRQALALLVSDPNGEKPKDNKQFPLKILYIY